MKKLFLILSVALFALGTVNAFAQEAAAAAKQLCEEGIDCIELCGAFGAEGAKQIIEITENRIPVGYVTHLPEQDEIYKAVFSK